MSLSTITIGTREIGRNKPSYIIAEMSANHGQDKEKAKEIIYAMKESGADAVKLQTYTPDTITLDCNNKYFVDCLKGTIWEGQSLYELYGEAYTPWDWQPELKMLAESLGMDFFSTPFDETAIDFLEEMNVPAYKIASFELVHLPLIREVARTGKPIFMSTGMGTKEEIQDAVDVIISERPGNLILLKCTSVYPAEIADANLATIPDMEKSFGVAVGLSDHTLGSAVPITSILQGACVIEKHFILDREKDKGPDSAFSMEPKEFREMVDQVRETEQNPPSAPITKEAIGKVQYGPSGGQKGSVVFRPSLFVIQDVKKGEPFTKSNTRILRPGYGLPPKYYADILNKRSLHDIPRGTPLLWDSVEK